MIHAFAAAAPGGDAALAFIELGVIVLAMALLARLASGAGFSPIPLYLVAGLAFGTGGLLPVRVSQDFIELGGQIGVVLLLFMLGLEYTAEELSSGLRRGLRAGIVDCLANFTPGLLAGLLLGWSPLAAVVLGGITYISSSGIIAKLLDDLDRIGNRETPAVLTVLVIEDLAMALYLPLLAALLVGGGLWATVGSVAVAVVTALVALGLALRFGPQMSALVQNRSDEVVLLTVFGLLLLISGLAERLQVSSAVGAFLLGIALSGDVAHRASTLLGPLRDLFAATFFLFFGLQVDPRGVPSVALLAAGLAVVTALTKLATGWYAARRAGAAARGRWRAGAALVARGEFSIVIAGLGVSAGVEAGLGPLAAAYVLFMAVLGPVAARVVEPVVVAVQQRRGGRQAVAGEPG